MSRPARGGYASFAFPTVHWVSMARLHGCAGRLPAKSSGPMLVSPSSFPGTLSFLILLSAFGLSSSCVPHVAFLILRSSSCSPLGRHTFDHCLDAAREMHQPPPPHQLHGAGLMQVGAALVVGRVRAWQFTHGDSLPKAFCRACTSRRTGTRARPSRRFVLRALTHSDHSIPARD